MAVLRGGVAQLGERRVRNAEVGSSILLLSTTIQKPGHVPGSSFSASAGLVSKPNADRWLDLIETMNSKDQHTTA